jgi:hypothetical protein
MTDVQQRDQHLGGESPAADLPVAGSAADAPPVASGVIIATPPDWRVLDLGGYVDAEATRSLIERQLQGRTQDGAAFAAKVAELAAGANEKRIFFAAVSVPGTGGSVDLTSVTLALPSRSTHARSDNAEQSRGAVTSKSVPDPSGTSSTAGDPAAVHAEPGPYQNAAMLPAGLAARSESSYLLEVTPRVVLPLFCVEYALTVPGSERVVVVTFTTIAPSDTERLRAEFADIASTLTFT